MSEGVLGIDVSGWQHPANKAIDWEQVAGAGYVFAVVKATQGLSFVNEWLERDLLDASAAGLLVGAYHYFDAGAPAAEQAQHFLATLVGKVLELGCWLDWEPGDMPDYQVSSEYSTFLEEVGKVRGICGTYCDNSWYARLRTLNLPVHRHWEAWPSTEAPSPRPFLWQFGTTTVPGVEGQVDVDRLYAVRGIDPCTAPPSPSRSTVLDTRSDEERETPEPAAAEAAEPPE